ncbi:hypothetical protein ACFL0Y_02845 [Patescibacteria group bacterium]
MGKYYLDSNLGQCQTEGAMIFLGKASSKGLLLTLFLVFLTVFLIFTVKPALAVEYYLSPDGSDSNSGSLNSP